MPFDAGAEVWSRAFPDQQFFAITLQCAGTQPLVGWEASGELVTVALGTNRERHTRLWESGAGAAL